MPGPAAPLWRDQADAPAAACAASGLALDQSRTRIAAADWAALAVGPDAQRLRARFAAQCAGTIVNPSEGRPALHTALRAPRTAAPLYLDGRDVHAEVRAERDRLAAFARAVRSGDWRAAGDAPIADVINAGIGGSDLGPRLVCDALQDLDVPGPRVHFVAGADGLWLRRLLPRLDPRRTLVVVSSKSFTTRETQLNAEALRSWFGAHGIGGDALARHLVVASARADAAARLGLPEGNRFALWPWVGGRFSLWSAVGLPILLRYGPAVFDALLDGAAAMDAHAATAPLAANLPARMACANFLLARRGVSARAVVAYDARLRLLPEWLQQLEMESLGKARRLDGTAAPLSCPAVFGGTGTEGQHSYFQWLREAPAHVAVELLAVRTPAFPGDPAHRTLLANWAAQSDALVDAEGRASGSASVATLALDTLDPRTLGALLAAYEHQVAMSGALLDVNPFDQPGVELGKRLALALENESPA